MSRFASIAARGQVVTLAVHGQPVTYTPLHGTAIQNVQAVVGPEEAELRELGPDQERYRARSLIVPIDDVPTPHRRGDTVTINGEAWSVHETQAVDGKLARLLIVRPEMVGAGGRRM